MVPQTYHELTTRRVLTSQWIEGEKLSQSAASDVGTLVQIGVLPRHSCCMQLSTSDVAAKCISSLVHVASRICLNLAGVIAYCKQLLETGNFHADPHPGAVALPSAAAVCHVWEGICFLGSYCG